MCNLRKLFQFGVSSTVIRNRDIPSALAILKKTNAESLRSPEIFKCLKKFSYCSHHDCLALSYNYDSIYFMADRNRIKAYLHFFLLSTGICGFAHIYRRNV